MRKTARFTAAIGAAALVGAAVTTAATASARSDTSHRAGSTAHADHRHRAPLDRIFVIMLENHSKSSIIGDPNAPFMNKLADHFQMASRYYGVTHPSMPNYIASIAGDNFGIQDDNDQNVVNLDRRNLVDQLERHHVRWDAYMDTLPANKLDRFWPDSTNPLYAKKHNPFVLFDDVKNNPARMRHVRDYSRLGHDLNGPKPPAFVWISPNQCHDMHGGVNAAIPGHPESPCPYGSTKDDANDIALKQKADAFVKGAVHTIRSSRAWTKRSAIVIVTDENDFTGTNDETGGWETADGCCDSPYVGAGDPRVSASWPGGTYGGGLIPAIVVSPQAPRHLVVRQKYNHYSLLTTIEDNWNMAHLGHAGDRLGGVRPMWPVFLGHRR
jgi:phosphatidylinositol-3-phosphatase